MKLVFELYLYLILVIPSFIALITGLYRPRNVEKIPSVITYLSTLLGSIFTLFAYWITIKTSDTIYLVKFGYQGGILEWVNSPLGGLFVFGSLLASVGVYLFTSSYGLGERLQRRWPRPSERAER